MSAINPHSNRERSRSSMELMSFGRQSEEMTNLFLLFVERVERVKKLFLRTLLARNELNIVNQQHVHRVEAVRGS